VLIDCRTYFQVMQMFANITALLTRMLAINVSIPKWMFARPCAAVSTVIYVATRLAKIYSNT